ARGAQYILPPNSVVYLGGAGDDKYAAILRDACKQAGLRVEYRVDPKVPTGRCGVVITGHNRSMVTELGAANHYDLEHLKRPDIWALVENAEVYYVGGYHFTGAPPPYPFALCSLLLLPRFLETNGPPQCALRPSWSLPSRPPRRTRPSSCPS